MAPLDNIECRKAVMYAADRTGLPDGVRRRARRWRHRHQHAAAGDPGLTRSIDPYPAGADNKGDVDKAKAALQACGQPNGFDTNMAYRSDRPKEQATAESLQQSLARVGIKLTLKPLPDR